MKKALLIVMAAWWLVGSVEAAVITVGSAGCDHTDLQTAIDDAMPDDELHLRLETFTGTNVNIDKDLVIIGGYVSCSDMIPDVGNPSTLQGGIGAGDSVIEVEGTFNAVQLTNLFITGGEDDADFGGGIGVGVASNITMSFVTVDGNDSQRGGGIFLDANAVLRRNGPVVISNNTADYGGGIYVNDLAHIDFADGSLQPLAITGNVASGAGRGGGIYLEGGAEMSVDDAGLIEVLDNQAILGGGLYLEPEALLDALRLEVEDNNALGGGGLYLAGDGGTPPMDPEVILGEDVRIRNNIALDGAGVYLDDNGGYAVSFAGRFIGNDAAADGGGLYYGGLGDVVFDGLILNSNSADSFGGGLYQRQGHSDSIFVSVINNIAGGDGGGVFLAEGATLAVSGQAVISGNTADSDGGGVAIRSNAVLETDDAISSFFNLLMQGNTAVNGDGGAIHADEGTFFLAGITIGDKSANAAPNGNGGGIYVTGGLNWSLTNARIRDNTAQVGGGIHITSTAGFQIGSEITPEPVPGRGVAACNESLLSTDEYCTEISGNTASAQAGGLYLSSPGAEVRNLHQVAIQNNQGGNPASGMYIDATDVTASNLLVADNSGASGIFVTSDGELFMEHATVVGNDSLGLISSGNAVFDIANSLFWANAIADFSPGIGSMVTGSCNLSSDFVVPDAITVAPRFITTARGKYRLSDLSPALDACGPAQVMVDLDGYQRPDGADYDIGAFEGGWGIPETLFADGFE